MKNLVMALGFFDTIHRGHKKLLEQTISIAINRGYNSAVFTFSNDIFQLLGNKSSSINTFEIRKKLIRNIGIDEIISIEADEKFLSKSGTEFLDYLIERYNIKYFVFGKDYTCGKNASFGSKDVIEYCCKKNIDYCLVDLEKEYGTKISTSQIKFELEKGEVRKANYLLGYRYFIEGKVVSGRKEGHIFGYPTVNLDIKKEFSHLKKGVYCTITYIDDKSFLSVTNVGSHPTMKDLSSNIETYIIDFNGNLYGRNIKIEFDSYIREIQQFNSVDDLYKQIALDVQKAKEIKQWVII